MFELTNPTQQIISEIENLKLKQADIAKTCAIAIKQGHTDFKEINAAIVKRWSKSARERVLTMAWKIIESTMLCGHPLSAVVAENEYDTPLGEGWKYCHLCAIEAMAFADVTASAPDEDVKRLVDEGSAI